MAGAATVILAQVAFPPKRAGDCFDWPGSPVEPGTPDEPADPEEPEEEQEKEEECE
jgi:hypothetical protein